MTYSHEWMIFLLVSIAYVSWAGGVGVWIPSMPSFWNDVLELIGKDRSIPESDDKWDSLGFGQVGLLRQLLIRLFINLTVASCRDCRHSTTIRGMQADDQTAARIVAHGRGLSALVLEWRCLPRHGTPQLVEKDSPGAGRPSGECGIASSA